MNETLPLPGFETPDEPMAFPPTRAAGLARREAFVPRTARTYTSQRNYDLPVIPMTQIERAQLLYTAGLTAIKQGDVNTGKSLLSQAVETHPRYFDAAVRSLEALEN